MTTSKVQKTNINRESEMPPMKKKDFFEMVKNNDEPYNQKQKEIIRYRAIAEVKERENKALASLLEREKRKRERESREGSIRK